MKQRALLRFSLRGLLMLFLPMNGIAFMHAYKLTHYASSGKKPDIAKFSVLDKLKLLFTGVDAQKPENTQLPVRSYQTVQLNSNKRIECWLIRTESARGVVALFHGYGGEKSSMLDKAEEFLKMGYNTLLVDFMGAGGSEGNQTTIGFTEAEEVKTCFDYLRQQGEKNIHLYGTSMGAVAVLKAIRDHHLQPSSVILECPFGTMYQTVCARFKIMGVPEFPMAGLLMFWGGVQNGFWAFSHNPEEYAKSVTCPALILYGEKDVKVSRREIDTIFNHLKGPKKLVTYPLAGHENYLTRYKEKWVRDVGEFLGIRPNISEQQAVSSG